MNNDAEAPGPIIDEKFHKIDPSIDNTDIKYLTANIETLLNETVAPQLVSYIAVPSSVVVVVVGVVVAAAAVAAAAAAAAAAAVVDYKFCLSSLINFIVHDINIVKIRRKIHLHQHAY